MAWGVRTANGIGPGWQVLIYFSAREQSSISGMATTCVLKASRFEFACLQ